MKIRFPLKVIKIFMKNQMQNKTYIILDAFNMISRCLVLFLIYGYVFKLSGGSINGVSYETTLWSMFIYFCLMTFRLRDIYKLIMDDVKSGNVEMFINKPISYLSLSFYKVIGKGLYSFLVITFFGTLIMGLFVGFPEINLLIFIPTLLMSLILGQFLALLIYSTIGLLSFFIHDVRPIYWIADKLVMILGGSYLPISMFPTYMKVVAYLSPFGAVNFATSTVYESWNYDFYIKLIIQIIWIVLIGMLLKFVFDKSKQKAMVNGG